MRSLILGILRGICFEGAGTAVEKEGLSQPVAATTAIRLLPGTAETIGCGTLAQTARRGEVRKT